MLVEAVGRDITQETGDDKTRGEFESSYFAGIKRNSCRSRQPISTKRHGNTNATTGGPYIIWMLEGGEEGRESEFMGIVIVNGVT